MMQITIVLSKDGNEQTKKIEWKIGKNRNRKKKRKGKKGGDRK